MAGCWSCSARRAGRRARRRVALHRAGGPAPFVVGLVAVVLAGLLQRIVPIAFDQLGVERDWLYSRVTGGLTWLGGDRSSSPSGLARRRVDGPGSRDARRACARPPASGRRPARGSWRRAGRVLATLPPLVGPQISQVLGTVMVFALLGLGLNIVVGYAGLLDLGYVAFYAFGAYAIALLTGATLNTTDGRGGAGDLAEPQLLRRRAGRRRDPRRALGVLIGAPVLRLRGDYLAIVTLGLGEIVSTITRSTWAQPLVGGPQGMRGVTNAGVRELRLPRSAAVLLPRARRSWSSRCSCPGGWRSSRVGRAWNAMREDEQVADAIGISTTKYKLLAFAIGGAIGSLGRRAVRGEDRLARRRRASSSSSRSRRSPW